MTYPYFTYIYIGYFGAHTQGMDVQRAIDYLMAELRKVDTAIESLEAKIEGSLAVELEKFAKKGYTIQTSHTPVLGPHAVGKREGSLWCD